MPRRAPLLRGMRLLWGILLLLLPSSAAAAQEQQQQQPSKGAGAAASQRPNIILLVTDDQDITLGGGLESMPALRKHLIQGGATVDRAFANTPVCCPSRATILTGRYPHNTLVTDNGLDGNCGSEAWRDGAEKQNIGWQLQQQGGYKTMFVGKYTNTYGYAGTPEPLAHVPPGWDRWVGVCLWPGNYYNYTLSVDGAAEAHGDDYARDYLTDLIANRTLEFVAEEAGKGQPFFAMLTPTAPHEMADPAPQHAGLLPDAKAPRTPSYNLTRAALEAGGPRNWLVANNVGETFTRARATHADLLYRRRSLSLMSVDAMVDRLVAQLEELDVLDNTYIVYTSDHGYHLGQFGMTMDKRLPYETDLRVPFFARGPKIPANTIVPLTKAGPIALVDVAPTLLDMAGLPPNPAMDGRSALPALSQGAAGTPSSRPRRRDVLVEYRGEVAPAAQHQCGKYQGDPDLFVLHRGPQDFATPPFYPPDVPHGSCFVIDARNHSHACLRTVDEGEDSLFCLFPAQGSGLVEFYDIGKDPWSLVNLAPSLSPQELAGRLARLQRRLACQGDAECAGGGDDGDDIGGATPTAADRRMASAVTSAAARLWYNGGDGRRRLRAAVKGGGSSGG